MVPHRDDSDASFPRHSESLSSRFFTFASSYNSFRLSKSTATAPPKTPDQSDHFVLSTTHLSTSMPSSTTTPTTNNTPPRAKPSITPPQATHAFKHSMSPALHSGRYLPKTAQLGRSRVWCAGHCMTGPDYRGTIITFFLAILIFTLECVFSFPWLITHRLSVAIPLITTMIISFIITAFSAYLASTTDPGIIPRSATLPTSALAFPGVRERVVTFHGRPITLRFCDTCRIWRPPRTSHCATCNNCVRRFDHHCPWLGNDVGLRNYRSYFCFVSFASIAEAIAITTSVLTLHWTTAHFRVEFPDESYASSIRRALSDGGTAVNIVLVLLCFLALLFTGGLTFFHIYLMSSNLTTAESFKKRARNAASSVDDLRGCQAIWFLQCTRREGSALVDGFDGPAYPEESALNALVDEQVQDEQHARSLIMSPPATCNVPIGEP